MEYNFLTFTGLYHDFSSTPRPAVVFLDTLESLIDNFSISITYHRHIQLHHIFLFESGDIEFYINGECINLSNNSILIIPENVVHGFVLGKESKGVIISSYSFIIEEILKDSPIIKNFILETKIFENINKTLFEEFKCIIKDLSSDVFNTLPEKSIMLKFKLGRLFVNLYRELINLNSFVKINNCPELETFNNFKSLLFNFKRENKKIDFYASQLGISKIKLNRICKAVSGKTPLWFINEALINDARLLLLFTNFSISEIAYILNFSTPNYFIRFFKKITGFTPKLFVDKYKKHF